MSKPREDETAKDDTPRKQSVETLPGEPGRTPGTAEGDRETVEESLRRQEEKEKKR